MFASFCSMLPALQTGTEEQHGKTETDLVRDNWEVRFCDNYDGRW
jgi:hypothetical protein